MLRLVAAGCSNRVIGERLSISANPAANQVQKTATANRAEAATYAARRGLLAKLWVDKKSEFEALAKEAKAAGALHHRWGFGDGEVVIVDDWPDAETFQAFFGSNATIPQLMDAAGVQGPPEFTIVESKTAPDEF